LLGAAAGAAYMKHSGVGARVQTANSTRTTSEVTEYNNFNDDLLTQSTQRREIWTSRTISNFFTYSGVPRKNEVTIGDVYVMFSTRQESSAGCTKIAAFGHLKSGLGDLEQKMT
jgi:hypothetical protein